MILDAEKNVWCPACRAGAGEPCKATKAATREYLAAVGKARRTGEDPPSLRIKLHVDHDGETEVHLQRISRADALADGLAQWRRDELFSLIGPFVDAGLLRREGRVVHD